MPFVGLQGLLEEMAEGLAFSESSCRHQTSLSKILKPPPSAWQPTAYALWL
jgi:hypothetical protein